MPGRNGTGPLGQGPLTGRGMGPCGGGYARGRHYFGRGMGFGYGGRFGGFYAGAGYYPAAEMTAEEQKDLLSERKAFLEKELNDLQKKLDGL